MKGKDKPGLEESDNLKMQIKMMGIAEKLYTAGIISLTEARTLLKTGPDALKDLKELEVDGFYSPAGLQPKPILAEKPMTQNPFS